MVRKAAARTYKVSVSQKVKYEGTASQLKKQLQPHSSGKVTVSAIGRKRKPSW